MPDPTLPHGSWATPDLQVLVELFYANPSELGRFTEVERGQVPEPFRTVLAHHSHMTVTLEDYHHCLVDVEVLQSQFTELHYSREIRLRRQSDGKVVMYGLVRLARPLLDEATIHEIAEQREPLGRILIRRNVLRNVKLLSLWRVYPGPSLRTALETPDLNECYGRTALIYCDGMPAVELVEIASFP